MEILEFCFGLRFFHVKNKTLMDCSLESKYWLFMRNLKNELYNRLSEKPEPIFIFQDSLIPAATIWVGVRAWVKFFRESNLIRGDRIILSYPESPAFIHILFASIWEKLTLIILKPNQADEDTLNLLDAKFIVTDSDLPFSIKPDGMGMPPETKKFRSSVSQTYAEVRFILQSSGSTGNPKFVGISEEAVFNAIQTHAKIFDSTKNTALSVLPWSHCFGLVLDLLLSTFHCEIVIRDQDSGKNLDSLIGYFEKYNITHFSSVPLLIERLLQRSIGFLEKLSSGIIGGAPISKTIASSLKNSNLSIGYGQTEASPGICLGEKGKIFANYIGNPLGCEVKQGVNGEFFFRGKNALIGYWNEGKIESIHKDTWIPTGDIVEEKEDGYFFVGRLDFSFKLSNGIMIQPETIEKDLKEKHKFISNCLLLYKEEIKFFFSSYSDTNTESQIAIIHHSLPPILKKTNLKIEPLTITEWIYSPKGEINRKAMMEKLK